jgi:molybdopterin synthase sulfur carrier subunit
MAINVRIPQPLRGLTGNQPVVSVEGASLSACIDSLETNYPGVRERVMDETGQLRRFVNVYINGDDVRFMDGLASALKDGDEVSIVPAVAGG